MSVEKSRRPGLHAHIYIYLLISVQTRTQIRKCVSAEQKSEQIQILTHFSYIWHVYSALIKPWWKQICRLHPDCIHVTPCETCWSSSVPSELKHLCVCVIYICHFLCTLPLIRARRDCRRKLMFTLTAWVIGSFSRLYIYIYIYIKREKRGVTKKKDHWSWKFRLQKSQFLCNGPVSGHLSSKPCSGAVLMIGTACSKVKSSNLL